MTEPITVNGKDGQSFQFPAGTTPDVMKQALQKHYGASQQAPQPNQMASPQLMEDPLGGPPVMPFGSKPDLLDDPFAYSPPVQQAKTQGACGLLGARRADQSA